MKSLPGRSNPHGEHATFPHLPCGEGFQGSLSLQCLEIVVCTAWEHYKGKTLLELDIMNSTSKVILCSGGETMRLTFSKVILQRLKSGAKLQKIQFDYSHTLANANLKPMSALGFSNILGRILPVKKQGSSLSCSS